MKVILKDDLIRAFCYNCKKTDVPCEYEKTCATMKVINKVRTATITIPKWLIEAQAERTEPSTDCSWK